MRTHFGVAFGSADPLNRRMRNGKVHFSGRLTTCLGSEAELSEQALRYTVVALILDKRVSPPVRQPGLAAVSCDESPLLQSC